MHHLVTVSMVDGERPTITDGEIITTIIMETIGAGVLMVITTITTTIMVGVGIAMAGTMAGIMATTMVTITVIALVLTMAGTMVTQAGIMPQQRLMLVRL